MGREQHFDDPERMAERQRLVVDPNPHLRRDSYTGARLAREVADIQRSEVASMPSNFLPPEQRRPRRHRPVRAPTPSPTHCPTRHDAQRRAPQPRRLRPARSLPASNSAAATRADARTRTFDVPDVFVAVRRPDAAGRPGGIVGIDWSHAHKGSPTDT